MVLLRPTLTGAISGHPLQPYRACLLLLTLFAATSTSATANSRRDSRVVAASGGWRRAALSQDAAAAAAAPALISTRFMILAQERTARPDPLNHFQKYRQGWDIRNEHYWASVGYTAAPGFIIAAVWLVVGALLLLLAACCCCCCSENLRGAHQGGTCCALLFLLLFTCAAVAGCALLYVAEGELRNELSNTLNYVVDQSNMVSTNLHNVSAVLNNTENIAVVNFALSASDKLNAQDLSSRLGSAANTLQTQTKQNAHNIRSGLNDVRLAIIVVAGVMLLLVLLGLLFSLLGATPLIYLLVFIVWFLVAGTWILFGVYLLLHNAVGDTCIAMEDWVSNPSAKTNLDEILPCVDVATASQALQVASKLVNETANGINGIISQLNINVTEQVPPLCNPVQANLSVVGCRNFTDAPEAWKPLVCGNNLNSTCHFTQGIYNQVSASVKTINDLYIQTPFLVDLADCQFVRLTFRTIDEKNCPGLRKYSKWEFIGLALVSGGTMLCIVFWIVYSRKRPHRHGHATQNEPKPK